MVHLILYILASYAAWAVFSTAELPVWQTLRELLMRRSMTFTRFILCPLCSGFWIALALAFVFPLLPVSALQWPGRSDVFVAYVLAPIVQAFAGACAVFLIEAHVKRLEER